MEHTSDDFEDGSFEPLWGTWGESIREFDGTANIWFGLGFYSEAGAYTHAPMKLRSCSIILEIVEPPNLSDNTFAVFDVHQDGDNTAEMALDIGHELRFDAKSDGVHIVPDLSIGFQRGEHRWWMFQERDGTMSMHTSKHGTNWTEHLSFPTPSWSSEVTVEFYAGSGADAGDPGVFRVDNFNLLP